MHTHLISQVQTETETELVAVKKNIQVVSAALEDRLEQHSSQTNSMLDELTSRAIVNRLLHGHNRESLEFQYYPISTYSKPQLKRTPKIRPSHAALLSFQSPCYFHQLTAGSPRQPRDVCFHAARDPIKLGTFTSLADSRETCSIRIIAWPRHR
jgi:hypothetical protein